jgi:iron(III) transport system ATP-binding protein
MQQRVALARALATQPALVLLDEPFSSLDAALRAGVRADVARVLTETGTTAVLVTHDQDEALSLADRVAVLRHGRVAQWATPEELYADPLDPLLAQFVGDANILEGTVQDGMAVTVLGRLPIAPAAPALADDVRVVVLIRPEKVRLAAGSPPSAFASRVTECRYFGHDMLVTVETGPAGQRSNLQARLIGRSRLVAGSPVSVSVDGPVKAWPA